MKKHFIFLALLITTSAFASEKEETNNNQVNQVDVRQILVTGLLAFSVYDQSTEDNSLVLEKKPKHTLIKQFRYKPEPKREKNKRRAQVNRRINQYRRR